MSVSKRVCERVSAGIKRFVPIVEQQRLRDVSEADTVTLVKDIMSAVLGWDKYTDLTSEFAIRNTFCDLAVRIDGKMMMLIEVKAIGISLEDRHLKQAVDYAANQGVDWVILTNGIIWRLYNVIFAKPIDKKLVVEINLTTIDCRREGDVESLYIFTKEGFEKGAHIALRDRQDATSRFVLAALLVNNDSVLGIIKRELRRVVNVSVSESEVLSVLRDEVIKRDALEGPLAESANRRVNRKEVRLLRAKRISADGDRMTDSASAPVEIDSTSNTPGNSTGAAPAE